MLLRKENVSYKLTNMILISVLSLKKRMVGLRAVFQRWTIGGVKEEGSEVGKAKSTRT